MCVRVLADAAAMLVLDHKVCCAPTVGVRCVCSGQTSAKKQFMAVRACFRKDAVTMLPPCICQRACPSVGMQGRIIHATAKLGALLNHPPAALSRMDLNALLPQPFSQMHGAWFKDPPAHVPATSCRAGAVVRPVAIVSNVPPV